MISKILKAAKESPFDVRDVHQFVRLKDFKVRGWDAVVVSGSSNGRKICDFLGHPPSNQGPVPPQSTPNRDWTRAILDARVLRVKSTRWLNGKSDENPD